MDDFAGYDEGFRLGTFDKCNGLDDPRVEEDGDIFSTGYYDAWTSNVAKIGERVEFDVALYNTLKAGFVEQFRSMEPLEIARMELRDAFWNAIEDFSDGKF